MNKKKIKIIMYQHLPVNIYLQILYFVWFKHILHLHNPVKFSEKIFCLQVMNKGQAELLRKCYDKYRVREYIIEKLGQSYGNKILNEIYGVYDDVDQIEFDLLPNKFALKITQSSGCNVICPDKRCLNIQETKNKLKSWQQESNSQPGKTIGGFAFDGDSKIVCERFIEDAEGNIPPDIRIYCFNGEPKLFVCDFGTTERSGEHGHKIRRNVYDINWNLLPVDLGRPHDETIHYNKPENLDELIRVAKRLSEDFYFVRVDLYNLNGKDILFGELTWIPMGGACVIRPERFDYEMGGWLDIPKLGVN